MWHYAPVIVRREKLNIVEKLGSKPGLMLLKGKVKQQARLEKSAIPGSSKGAKSASPLPPDEREALIVLLAQALVQDYLRTQGVTEATVQTPSLSDREK